MSNFKEKLFKTLKHGFSLSVALSVIVILNDLLDIYIWQVTLNKGHYLQVIQAQIIMAWLLCFTFSVIHNFLFNGKEVTLNPGKDLAKPYREPGQVIYCEHYFQRKR